MSKNTSAAGASVDDFTNIIGGAWSSISYSLNIDFTTGYGTEYFYVNNNQHVRVPNQSWWRYQRITNGFNNYRQYVSTSSENGPWLLIGNNGFHGNRVICGVANTYGRAVCIARIVSCVTGAAY